MVLVPAPGINPDDLFGVREALQTVPETSWDDFFVRWAALAESTSADLAQLQVAAKREACWRSFRAGPDDPLAVAWSRVSETMARYLDWRRSTRPSA